MLNTLAWLIVALLGIGFTIRGADRSDNWSILGGLILGTLGLIGLIHSLLH